MNILVTMSDICSLSLLQPFLLLFLLLQYCCWVTDNDYNLVEGIPRILSLRARYSNSREWRVEGHCVSEPSKVPGERLWNETISVSSTSSISSDFSSTKTSKVLL